MSRIQIISTCSTLLLVIFYLVFKKRNDDRKFRVLLYYAIYSIISDLLLSIRELKKADFYFYSTFTIIEFTIFSYFFYQTYKEKAFRSIVIVEMVIFSMFFVYSILNNYAINFDWLTSSIEGLFIIILCILFFYEQLRTPEINFIYASKTFWVITAFFIYSSATFFLFMSMGFLTLTLPQKNILWNFNTISNIIKNILFGVAFYKLLIMAIDSSKKKEVNLV